MNKIRKILYTFSDIWFVPEAIRYGLMDSYYPEKRDRSKIGCVLDSIRWLYKFHEVNYFYMLYGFDCKSINQKSYMDYKDFYDIRNERNKLGTLESQACLLRDKTLFNIYGKDRNSSSFFSWLWANFRKTRFKFI